MLDAELQTLLHLLLHKNMAGFAANTPVRSTSLPTRLHPLPTAVKEEIEKLKSHVLSSASSTNAMCASLEAITELYVSVDDFLHLPNAQREIKQLRGEPIIERKLDEYIRLLDACNVARDVLFSMKEHSCSMQSMLRTRGEHETIAREVNMYLQSRKHARKVAKRCLAALRPMDGRHASLTTQKDAHLPSIIHVVTEVNAVSMSVFKSFFEFTIIHKLVEITKTDKLSLVSRAIHNKISKKKEWTNELENTDAAIYTIHRHVPRKEATSEMVHMARRRLENLEICIERLEVAVQKLYRRIIQIRVSILNTLSM